MSQTKGMIKPFVDKQKEKGKSHLVCRLMDMMQEFQMNLKFLLM